MRRKDRSARDRDALTADTSPVTAREGARGAFAIALVGLAVAVWWPSFTLGAWGELFFDQMLTVWAAATAAFLVVLVRPAAAGRRWPSLLALAVPSLWLALAFLDDAATPPSVLILVDVLGGIVGIVGLPFALWTLCRLLWPDLFSGLRRRARWGVAIAVLIIAVASFLLGVFQDLFLSCADFDVSGNSRPPGCVSTPAQ